MRRVLWIAVALVATAPLPHAVRAQDSALVEAPPAEEAAPAEEPAPAEEAAPPSDVAVDDVAVADEAEIADVNDQSLEDLLGLELEDTLGTTSSVSRTSEDVLSAPASLSTLDHAAIRSSGARTIPDLLRMVPGVQVYQSGPGNFTVALRGAAGLTGNNVVVLVDGIPINSPLDGSIEWALVPVHVRDIERIEVVRGPVSTIYGANAYTGVISITTYRGFGHEPMWGARIDGGTDFELQPFGSLGARYVHNGRDFQQAWFIQGQYDSAFAANGDTTQPPLAMGSVLGRLGWTTSAGQIDAQLAFAYGQRSSLDHLVLESNPEERTLGTVGLGWTSTDLPEFLGTMRVWGRSLFQTVRTDVTRYQGMSYADTNASRSAFGLDLEVLSLDVVQITIGTQLDLDWIEAPYLHPNVRGAVRAGYGFYARSSLTPWENWSFTLAARGDSPTVNGQLAFSYRGSIVYHQDDFAIRLAGASAYRAPTYVEAGGRFVERATGLILLEGSPQIANPQNDTLELGVTFATDFDLQVSATVFGSRLSNLMIEDFEPLVRKTFVTERDDRYVVGGELELAWRFTESFSMFGAAGFNSYARASEQTLPTVGVPAQNSPFSGSIRAQGTTLGERLLLGGGVTVGAPRDFLVRAGVPPVILERSIGWTVQLQGVAEFQPTLDVPLWLSLRVQSDVAEQLQSPLPGAGRVGTTAMFGVELRRD